MSFWVLAHPMTGDVTLKRHLSLAEPKPRIVPIQQNPPKQNRVHIACDIWCYWMSLSMQTAPVKVYPLSVWLQRSSLVCLGFDTSSVTQDMLSPPGSILHPRTPAYASRSPDQEDLPTWYARIHRGHCQVSLLEKAISFQIQVSPGKTAYFWLSQWEMTLYL